MSKPDAALRSQTRSKSVWIFLIALFGFWLFQPKFTECLGQQANATVQFASGFYYPGETGGPSDIRVTRTGNTNTSVSVGYVTGKGTATPAADFQAMSGTLVFQPGVLSASFSIPILDDSLAEGTEVVELALTNPSAGAVLGVPATARLMILDNENRGTLLDSTFTSPLAPTDVISSIVVRPDGKILASGRFARTGSQALERTIHVHPDGTRDLSFGSTDGVPNSAVHALALQPDGKILIGGEFTRIGSQVRNRLARLNSDGTLDLSFDPRGGFTGSVTPGVYAIAVQRDGKIIVAGNFDSFDGVVRNTVARLNADGSLDSTFNPGAGVTSSDSNFRVAWLSAAVVQLDGKVLIGGQFTDVGGLPRLNIARLNPNASVDGSFDPGSGALGDLASVEAIALQSDGKIIIGGDFSKVNGVNRGSIARLQANGSVDTSFDPGPGVKDYDENGDEIGGLVTALAIQSDGKILLSGSFKLVDDINRRGVARLNSDGSVDPTFGPYSGTTFRNELGYEELDSVYGLAIQSDGKVLIGGTFVSADGSRTNRLTRLLSENSRASTFEFASPSVSVGENAGPATVKVIRRGDSTKEFTVGFITAGGRARSGADYTAQAGTVRFAPLETEKTVTVPILDDQIVEEHETFNLTLRNPSVGAALGDPVTCVIRIIDSKKPGNLDFSFADITVPFPSNPTAYLPVTAISIQADGKSLVAGHFSYVNDTDRAGLVRFDIDGKIDASFVPEIPAGAASLDFHQMGLQPGGQIIGGFDGLNRINSDGSIDTRFVPDVSGVNAMIVQTDGKFLVADEFFDSLAGVNRNQVSRFLQNGRFDTSFSPPAELDDWANGIAAQPDGKVIIGGYFSTVNGEARNRIARLNIDATLDASFDVGAGVAGPRAVVYALALQLDGKVIAVGDFNRVNSASRNNIARLNSDGSPDASFDPGSGPDNFVESLSIQADGKILIGGRFASVDGVRRLGLARLNKDGSLDLDFQPELGFSVSVSVSAIAMQSDGKVIIGGLFTTVHGIPRSGIARLNGDASFVRLDSLPSKPAGLFKLTLTSQPGKQYRIEASTDLTNWVPIGTAIAKGFTIEFEDPAAKGPFGRFYRAVLIGP